MHEHASSLPHQTDQPRGGALRYLLMTAGFMLIAGFFLFSEHRAHLLGILPYLFLLACPLLHLFGHGGHHGDGRHERADAPDAPKEPTP